MDVVHVDDVVAGAADVDAALKLHKESKGVLREKVASISDQCAATSEGDQRTGGISWF